MLLVLVAIAYPVSLGLVAWGSLNRVGPMAASSVGNSPGRTVLLVGSDSREGLSADQEVQLSTGPGAEITGARTDTIMLLHTPPLGGPSVLVSLPRDSYVAIPGHGSQKINAAFALGGPQLLEATVEQATSIHLDGYAETGLAGFAGMVDAVGGVTMCPSDAIDDPKAGLNIPAGCQTMDGATALGYARSRDSAVGGDLGRAQRQRELIGAIAKEAASPATLLNPFTAYPLAKAGGGALSVDDGTGPLGLARFANAFRSVASGSAISLTVPVASANRSTNAGLVVDWDEVQSTTLFDAIRTNDTTTIESIAAAQPNLEGSTVGG